MAMGAMRKAALNIRQGNTVSIVVRGRESRPHGEVRQSTAQYNLRKGVRDTMRSPEVILKNLGQHRTIAEASAVESPIRQETIGFPAHFFARAHNFKPPGRACQPEADSPMRT